MGLFFSDLLGLGATGRVCRAASPPRTPKALRLGNTFLKKRSPHNPAAKADHDAGRVKWGRKMEKIWEDMTTNEKLDLLKAQIQELRSAFNVATSGASADARHGLKLQPPPEQRK
jgi:hypothetical protein